MLEDIAKEYAQQVMSFFAPRDSDPRKLQGCILW